MYLAGTGIGNLGIVDDDKVHISNLHRQVLFDTSNIKKSKSKIAFLKIKKINPNINVNYFKTKLLKNNINKIANDFDILIDGSDNFRTRFLINDYCFKNKKILISGAISKFEGHVYTFNFTKKNSPCLRCFIAQEPKDLDTDNCEYDGILGALGGIVGSIQANEAIKEILKIGNTLCGYILIIDSLKMTFRKVKLNKRSNCYCNEKKL